MHSSEYYTPIKTLNTFNMDWKIKARVTKKYPLKEWRNAKGQGFLLNIELVDSLGTEIQGTFFNDQAKKFDEVMKQGRVYLISGGQIKMANKKFTSIPNDHCISFDRNTEVQETPEDTEIQHQSYNFITLDKVETLPTQKPVDVIGIIHQMFPTTQVTLKSGKTVDKKSVTMADKSQVLIEATLWDSNAREAESFKVGQVMALKNAQIHEFNQSRSLSCWDKTHVAGNPDVPETKVLTKLTEGTDVSEFRSLTKSRDKDENKGMGSL